MPPPALPHDCDPQAGQPSVPGSVPSVIVLPSFADGKPVEVDPHHILIEDPDGSCALILDNLSGMDSGQYMCFAASAAGNASTLGKILVQGELTPGGRLEEAASRLHSISVAHGGCRSAGGGRVLLCHAVSLYLFPLAGSVAPQYPQGS